MRQLSSLTNHRPRSVLLLALPLVIAAVAFAAWFKIAGAGGRPNPDADVHPGFVGQAVPPTPTAISKPGGGGANAAAVDGAATINEAAVIEIATTHVGSGDSIDAGSARAELLTFADIPQLRQDGRNYVDDYPIWVVHVTGHFIPSYAPPPPPIVAGSPTPIPDSYSVAIY